MNRLARWVVSLLFAFSALFAASRAEATHFRYGNITWNVPDPVNAPLTVEFTVTHAWRTTFIDTVTLQFGDGQQVNSGGGDVTIGTGVDAAGESYTIREFVTSHTYASPGNRTAFFTNCCRVSSLINAGDANFRVEAQVDLQSDGSNTSGPISGIPVIIQMEIGGVRQFVLPVFDPDNDPYTCNFSTTAQSGIPANPPTINGQPITFVSPGCTIQWDLSTVTNASVNNKYALSIEVESTHNGQPSSTMIDYIIELVPQNTVPTCSGGGNFTAGVGQAFSQTLQFNEPGGGVLNLSVNNAPGGSVVTPPNGSTLNPPYPQGVNFAWTPTLADAGTTKLVQFVG
ncbi:MAG: hypothetical protein R3B72_51510, partial [Polyangiaceae bacterium]